jgi:phosphopantetheine--protein transferase-like protein
VIILSTSKCDAHLVSVGIDAEKISRFTSFVNGNCEVPELIFSNDEFTWCLESNDPAASMCASFTFKEALFKSIGPYNYPDCFLKVRFEHREQTGFGISDALLNEKQFSFIEVFTYKSTIDEVVTVVHTWRKRNG